MLTQPVSLPMYAIDAAAVEAFWLTLRQEMRAMGLQTTPETLVWPDNLMTHWRDPRVLLSQTCGYPFVTSLAGQVRYVGTPCFRAPGCAGPFYSSAVVVRNDDEAHDIAACAGKRVAFNSRDSQSGYNALRALVAPYAREGRFFAGAIETGAHRASVAAVRTGQAEIAAIDAVTLALLSNHAPAETEGLRVLAYTDRAPGLPFVTSLETSDEDVTRLRGALATACAGSVSEANGALLLEGVEVLPVSAYATIAAMRTRADALGYPDLC